MKKIAAATIAAFLSLVVGPTGSPANPLPPADASKIQFSVLFADTRRPRAGDIAGTYSVVGGPASGIVIIGDKGC